MAPKVDGSPLSRIGGAPKMNPNVHPNGGGAVASGDSSSKSSSGSMGGARQPYPVAAAPHTLASDTLVFQHAKMPSSRRSGMVAGLATSASPSAAVAAAAVAFDSVRLPPPPPRRQQPVATSRAGDATSFAPRLKPYQAGGHADVQRLHVRVEKQGDKLGFGVRHDRHRRLKVSTIQGSASELRVGDTLLSVNSVDLTGLAFLDVIQQLKATRPGELLFEIERTVGNAPQGSGRGRSAQSGADRPASQSTNASVGMKRSAPEQSLPPAPAATAATTSPAQPPAQTPSPTTWSTPVQPATASTSAPVEVSSMSSSSATHWSPNGGNGAGPLPLDADRNALGFRPTASASIVGPVTGSPDRGMSGAPGVPVAAAVAPRKPVDTTAPPPKKRGRPPKQRPVNGDNPQQPVNVNALIAELKKERTGKAALEEKNAGLRKKLQRMLIDYDQVRVRAAAEVAAAKEKAQQEVAEAQKTLAAARAQMRLQDRGPNVARTDSIVNELTVSKAQVERLKKAEAERNALMNARYRSESRIAGVDARRVLDTLVELFRAKLRHVGRIADRDEVRSTEIKAACDGVRRLAFLNLFGMPHDYAYYVSAAFQSLKPVEHTIEQEQFTELFGNSLCHEERAGVFFVATAPMHVVYDPSTESVVLTCLWGKENALRDLARNFRF